MRPKRKSTTKEKVYIYGKHSLIEALTSVPKVIKKVFLASEVKDADLQALLEKHTLPVSPLAHGRGSELAGRDAVHQGVIAVMDPSALLVSLDDFLTSIEGQKNPSIAILGEVQDPHNVGAIIRSAAAFGLSGVLIPEHHQAGITGTVVKTSAGMAFHIPLVSIGNVNTTIKTLKEKGFWIYGLAMNGSAELGSEAFDTPTAFIVGNEGAGIREKTLSACDVTLSIPMHPRTESLNAAVSGAIVFYAWSKKHPEALHMVSTIEL
jgi:23S rRNA (guanosine2251-2'-O)-methyltransferase